MHEVRTHIAMDGNSYTEYVEDPSCPGSILAIFHPQFSEQGYALAPSAMPPGAAPGRLNDLLRQLFGTWGNEPDTPVSGAV